MRRLIDKNICSVSKMKGLCTLLLIVDVFILLFVTVWQRETITDFAIHRDLFWSYKISIFPYMTIDSLYNILLFIPVGVLVGLLSARYRFIKAMLVGLFLSETIECLQLIFMKGAFDVDDLFNNTLGAFIGGLFVEMFVLFRRRIKTQYNINNETDYTRSQERGDYS